MSAQPKIVEQLTKARASMVENTRRLIRQMKKDEKTVGQNRVLKGWWKPERYPDLTYCGRETVQTWLGA